MSIIMTIEKSDENAGILIQMFWLVKYFLTGHPIGAICTWWLFRLKLLGIHSLVKCFLGHPIGPKYLYILSFSESNCYRSFDWSNAFLQDIPLVKLTEKTRGPGIAKPVESPTEPQGKDAPLRVLSEEEAQQLDKDCTERFIKVNVKHITDGQVICNFVLLKPTHVKTWAHIHERA